MAVPPRNKAGENKRIMKNLKWFERQSSKTQDKWMLKFRLWFNIFSLNMSNEDESEKFFNWLNKQ